MSHLPEQFSLIYCLTYPVYNDDLDYHRREIENFQQIAEVVPTKNAEMLGNKLA